MNPAPVPISFVAFFKHMLVFYDGGLLIPPAYGLEDHPLSAFREWVFNTFTAILHIWRPSPLSAT